MKGEALAFFSVHFFASFGHVGARGAQMTESNFFLRALPVEAFFCNDRKQRQKAGFCNPKRRQKRDNGPKRRSGKTRFLENKRFECATRAGKKGYIRLGRG